MISFLLWVQLKIYLNCIYFIFSLINGLNKFLHFHHLKLITWLVTCIIMKLLLWSLVNDTFSNFKLTDFVITGFISKELKQVVLITHRWIPPSPPAFTKGLGIGVLFIHEKEEVGVKFFSQKRGRGGGWQNGRERLKYE